MNQCASTRLEEADLATSGWMARDWSQRALQESPAEQSTRLRRGHATLLENRSDAQCTEDTQLSSAHINTIDAKSEEMTCALFIQMIQLEKEKWSDHKSSLYSSGARSSASMKD